jgi:uncharacterized protein YkwD
MASKDPVRIGRKARPATEALDGRVLLSTAGAGSTGVTRAALALAERAQAANGTAARIMTPELRQALESAPGAVPFAPASRLAARPPASVSFAARPGREAKAVPPSPSTADGAGPKAVARPGRHRASAEPAMRYRAAAPHEFAGLLVSQRPGPLVLAPADARFIALAVPQNASVVTQAIVDLTNHVRAENGVPTLNPSPALMEAAQLHSDDMARLGQMQHDLSGVPLATLPDRAEYVHYEYQLLGENIAYNQADPASVVAAWMNSPPHRENMLDAQFVDIGVGIAWNRRGEPYYTMVLGKPA